MNDTPRSSRTVPRHCQKTEVCGSLIVGVILSLINIWNHTTQTNHRTFYGQRTALALCNGPHPVECASLWIPTNPRLNYCCVFCWSFFNETSRTWASLGPETRHWGFWPREKSWRTGGKSSGKNMLSNPLHNLLENMLNTLTCAHNSHWSDPWHKED